MAKTFPTGVIKNGQVRALVDLYFLFLSTHFEHLLTHGDPSSRHSNLNDHETHAKGQTLFPSNLPSSNLVVMTTVQN
jgi:hypothetical protein